MQFHNNKKKKQKHVRLATQQNTDKYEKYQRKARHKYSKQIKTVNMWP